MHARSLFACLAVLVTACSGTTVGSTADAEHFCTTLSNLLVEKEAECFKVAPAVRRDYADQTPERCAATQHEVDAGRASYDPVKGAACAHGMAALPACSAYAVGMDPTADCNTALRGAVPTMGACWSATDCADGFCAATSQCGGQCLAYSTEGQPCTAPCAPGLVCAADPSGDTTWGICSKLSDAGGPCPCKQGLYCEDGSGLPGGQSTATPSCQPQRESGFCHQWDACAAGFVCAGDVSSCVPLVGLGASCGAAARCGWGSYCDPATSACAAYPDLGQPCVLTRDGTTAQLPCMHGWCDASGTKKCVSPKADGEPCSSYDECASYACDTVQQRCVGSGYVPQVCVPP